MKRRRVEVNVGELDQLLEGARQAPLSDPDYEKISTALHALVDALAKPRTTEKSSSVLGKKDEPETGSSTPPDPTSESKPPGHGRNGADAFESARKVEIQHQQLKSGDSCPECPNGKVYVQKEPKALIRIVGQAPIQATVYNLERLRCNLCGQVFTAEAPEGVGADKYDETVGSMVAQLKYGSGMPFNRLEKLEQRLGVPLPATTQWEIAEEAAELLEPAFEELIRQGAQGEIFHNDDTSMKILKLERPEGDTRTGVFTSGIVSIRGNNKIAMFFTGRLRVKDLQSRQGVMHFRIKGKRDKIRFIPAHAAAQRLIEDYLALAGHAGDTASPLFRPVKNNRTKEGLVRHLDPASVYRNIVCHYGWMVGVGGEVTGLCVHSLRATAATNALSHQADIAKVQEWLGHANVSTTRLYDRRKTKPEDSPTFRVKY